MRFWVLLLSTFVMVGCATTNHVVEKELKTLRIVSEPAEALVYANDQYIGVTPINFKLVESERELGITLFKPGYVPVKLKVDNISNSSMHVVMVEGNKRLYDLLVRRSIRFTKRTNMASVALEPSNRPMRVGSAFIVRDPSTDREFRFKVVNLTDRFIWLQTGDGANVVFPVIQIEDNR